MKLIDVFPTWAAGALFARLGEKYPDLFPWATSILDVEYFGNHSGNKTISTLVEKLLTSADVDAVDAATLETLVEVIKNRYAVTWGKLYAVMSAEYNPIENYSMVEEETPNITLTETPNITRTETPDITRTETPDITRTETPNITREETPDVTKTKNTSQKSDVVVTSNGLTAAGVFGFNSSDPVPQAETNGNTTQRTQGDAENNITDETETETGTRTQTETGNRTETETGTRTHTETGNRTETETGTRTHTETGNRKLTRSGNIGVTTSQQMLTSEIALWQWNFYQTVYRDTDTVLTCPVYEL